MLREQGGEELYTRVEEARQTAIRRRDGASDAEQQLLDFLHDLEPSVAEQLVRGFAAYFGVVNLAEKVHRIRRRRHYLRTDKLQPGSLDTAFAELADHGVELAQIRDLVQGLSFEPVFTAHPTQATRRSLLEKDQVIARCLVEQLDRTLTPPELAASMAQIRDSVTGAWQTDQNPSERPTVGDEMEHVLFYVTDVLYRVVPPFYEALERAIEKAWGEPIEIPSGVLRFASWVGGDMDGNPNVTAETIGATLARHRQLVLRLYHREALDLARSLSQSTREIGVDTVVSERVELYRGLLPAVAIKPRHRTMPYRMLLRYVAARLQDTGADRTESYDGPEELATDLQLIITSLDNHQGHNAGQFAVKRFLRRVETFGFHLATLDVRQDALLHRAVVGRLLGEADWLEQDADARAQRLRRELSEPPMPPPCKAGEEDRPTLAVFGAIRAARQRYGKHAIGPFITSMTQGADDLLSVLLLARWGGLASAAGEVPLDIAPLFETVPDLRAAPRIMGQMVAEPVYGSHLERRGRRQLIMVGYSDSSKEGGIAASRWALQQAQSALVDSLAAADVHLTVFHGRGGTISRGGSKTHRAVLAEPPGAVGGHLRVTEQGEVIDAKYGLRGIALRSLEQAVGAIAKVSVTPKPGLPRRFEAPPEWRQIVDQIGRANRREYRALVYDEPDFEQYFRLATPIDVIERMAIGSRPASRRKGGGIGNLRAIPWVFSWTQSRHLLPGWYGLGTALERAGGRYGASQIAELVAEWPFFGTLFEDLEMAGDYGAEFFPRIQREYQRTVAWVLKLRRQQELLDHDPTLQRSIQLRNPYVDPMSLLQIDLLRRWRASERQDPALLSALLSTVHGIARGLKNTAERPAGPRK
nr:phosphoenolpyruvate carboxylase-like [Nerophis lumbriciformis]